MNQTYPLLPATANYNYRLLQTVVQNSQNPDSALIEAGMVYQYLLRDLIRGQQQFFASDYERLIVIINFYHLPPKLAKSLKKTGFLLSRAAKKTQPGITLTQLQQIVLALCLAIEHFSGVMPPTDLYDFCQPVILAAHDDDEGNIFEEPQTIALLKAVVLQVGSVQQTREGKPYFVLTCTASGFEELRVYLWEAFVYLQPLLWQYARLNLSHLKLQTPAQDDKLPMFSATPETLATLDPDFLIDVTDISQSCLRNGASHVMHVYKMFTTEGANYYLLRGNIVNAWLDAYLRDEPVSILELFKQYIQNNPTHALTFNNEDFRRLKDEAIKHLATIDSPLIQAYKQYNLNLEPTFLSDTYGLRGRLDVLVNYPDNEHHRDVIELKTSKDPMPWRPVYERDALQAVSYYLLLESTDPLQTGSTAILYSAVPLDENPLRNVPNDMTRKQRVLQLRNHIVAAQYLLSQNPEAVLNEVNPNTPGTQNLFDADIEKLQNFSNTLVACSPLEKAYFYAYTAFTAREQRAAKIGTDNDRGDRGFSGLWNHELKYKEKEFTILAYLEFKELIVKPLDIELVFDKTENLTLDVARFRVGDMVLIYPHEPDEEDILQPMRHQIMKATIKQLSNRQVVISPMNKHISRNHFTHYPYWAIEAEGSDVGYEASYQSLYEFIQLPQAQKQLLLGLSKPEFVPYTSPIHNPQLKPLQMQVLQKALSAQNYFLLQGPPGTGKTKVMMRQLVTEILKTDDEKIILLAYTNRAVDEMCEALADFNHHTRVFRLGYGSSTEHPELLLSRFAKENTLTVTQNEIKKCRIFIATVLTYQRSIELRSYLENKTLNPRLSAIIDEASQLLEPQIIGLLGKVDRFILIGDEKQLPAVVIQSEASTYTDDEALNQIGISNLSVSLFERLLRRCYKQGWNHAYAMLQDQGRMHQKIAQYPSYYYYDNLLQHIEPRQTAEFAPFFAPSETTLLPFLAALKTKRTVFLATQPENERNRNQNEARMVQQLVEELIPMFSADELENGIGIISPYRTQIAEIKRHLGNHEQSDCIVVDTVERYQGGQKSIIIVSLAVNDVAQLKHLHVLNEEGNVDKKLNVTLTRAKEYLILIGCAQVLEASPIYQPLLDYYRQNKAYFTINL